VQARQHQDKSEAEPEYRGGRRLVQQFAKTDGAGPVQPKPKQKQHRTVYVPQL